MRLSYIQLRNYRRYERGRFNLNPRFTVLIGENGKGKTTILDAIAVMLGTYLQGSRIKTGRSSVQQTDARLVIHNKGEQVFFEPQKEVYLVAEGLVHGKHLKWERHMRDRGGKARNLTEFGKKAREEAVRTDDQNIELPLLLYYGSGRLWDIHRHIKTKGPDSQLDAYRFCLDPKSDQKAFEKWFKRLSLSQIQKGKAKPQQGLRRGPTHASPTNPGNSPSEGLLEHMGDGLFRRC